MDQITKAFLGTLQYVLGSPSTMIEFYTLIVLPILIGVPLMSKFLGAIDARNPEAWRCLFTEPLGLILVMAALTAAAVYAAPLFKPEMARWVLIGAGVIVSLVIVIPLQCWVHKMGYGSGIFVWALTVLAVVALVYVLGILFDTAFSVGKDAGKAEERKEALQDFINLQ